MVRLRCASSHASEMDVEAYGDGIGVPHNRRPAVLMLVSAAISSKCVEELVQLSLSMSVRSRTRAVPAGTI